MDQLQCCRTCLAANNLNSIFLLPEHHEKYSEVILEATGVKMNFNDTLPQQMCTDCIIFTNKSYKFRKKCQEAQTSLLERLEQNLLFNVVTVKIEGDTLQAGGFHTIDISDLINFDESNKNESNLDDSVDPGSVVPEIVMDVEEPVEKEHKKIPSKEKKTLKRARVRKTDEGKERDKKKREKEEIECEYCHKILTSKLSLRNHYKIHTGFDVVCEHCGKKFITRRLLLMHCKAKHGYEKTDKCSFCEYRASNAEQVKIHERLHTGERPYVCAQCAARFHRKSSYLQHVATHLPEKTVQCTVCPSRFKSVTLMRIHASRHRAPVYTYKCVVCAHSFARRRNVARHLARIHAVQPLPEHIQRTKCA